MGQVLEGGERGFESAAARALWGGSRAARSLLFFILRGLDDGVHFIVPPFHGFYPWLPTPVNLVALATTAKMSWRGWISVIGVGLLSVAIAAAVAVPRVQPVAQRVRTQYPLVRRVIDSWQSASVRSPESAHIRWDDFWVTGVWAESAPIANITHELIAQCPRLKYLDLSSIAVGDDEMAGVEALGDLEELRLNHTRVGDATLERLARLPRLRELQLADTTVTDAGLARLREAHQLRQLDLGNARISGRGLAHLAGLEGLRELSLGGTDVQDDDLKYLAGLKSLQDLGLGNTAITDQGLPYLLDLSGLEQLNVAGTTVTPEGAEKWQRLFEERNNHRCWVRGKERSR